VDSVCKGSEQEAAVIELVVLEHGLKNTNFLSIKRDGTVLIDVTLRVRVVRAARVDSNANRCTATIIVPTTVVKLVTYSHCFERKLDVAVCRGER
jgi:hypothetical protein